MNPTREVLTAKPGKLRLFYFGAFGANSLRAAIGTGALLIVFQPIVTASTGLCETLEVLARWNHPERGPISPAEFHSSRREDRGIGATGRWVLSNACREAASWSGARPLSVSVNVSAVQVESGKLSRDVSTGKAAGLSPTRLQLELTESVFAGDHRNTIPILGKLRETGIKISLDDFGTGFS